MKRGEDSVDKDEQKKSIWKTEFKANWDINKGYYLMLKGK